MSATATYTIDGMTCGHCVSAVTSELTEIPGVLDVTVELVTGGSSPVTITSETPIDRAAIIAAVNEAGYVVTPPRSLL